MGSCLSDHCRSEWRQHLPYHWRQPVDTIRMECVLSFSSSDVLLSVAARSLSDFGCKLVKVRECSLYGSSGFFPAAIIWRTRPSTSMDSAVDFQAHWLISISWIIAPISTAARSVILYSFRILS